MNRLRYFFDPGSSTCLWAANESASAAYGYAVDHNELPLTPRTKALLNQLTIWFDKSIDWNNPTDRGAEWTRNSEDEFLAAADVALAEVIAELGTGNFEISANHRSK
jgi:hypothetical protein